MDAAQVIGLIVGVVVVLAIAAVAVLLSRKRRVAADRTKAAEMREKAEADEFSAREREAKAARAEADAQQAEVEAERLRREARGRQEEADSVRAGAQEQLRKADEVDPDFVAGERDDAVAQQTQERESAAGSGEEPRRQTDAGRGHAAGVPSDPGNLSGPRTEEDRPRNL
ncbi:hypothetical protein [Arthrobacter sp. PAMC25284]|uniref:hypothetical protein n=1 Tax=Arthrobacter sp. PAMC25284 TaxID=2861279 RepID=UPI001C629A2E|nr:hypothetical protein [Arthrobacter sp. PAMC25284]QYF88529.1 hypothetical protein KY499_09595 [Arthrobacter sp. PAMC25284]